ncbi:MAG: nitroreductase family protein [Proteobacteria bacterium]|nr:nitroreductase family protein [Pseudomonadota bacterium]MBU1611871.1 nitroreductase family protein [Pseudomonadota bacterium]
MDFKQLVATTRSTRRFDECRAISMAELESLVDLVRLSASAGNLQPLRYMLVTDSKTRAKVFSTLGWAAYLPKWAGPEEGERPMAYLVQCMVTAIGNNAQVDAGIQAQTLLLGARSTGIAGCVFGSVNRDKLAEVVDLPETCEILYVIALGAPGEPVVVDELAPGGDIKYWRDADGTHHVPKRTLEELILSRYGNDKEPM